MAEFVEIKNEDLDNLPIMSAEEAVNDLIKLVKSSEE